MKKALQALLIHMKEDVWEKRIMHWFYTAVVGPILTYEAFSHLLSLRL